MKKKFVMIACASLLTAHCSHKETREPAGTKTILTDDEAKALSDLISTDSPLNPYRRPMKIEFHIDGDKEYLQQTAKKAFREALAESLGGDTPEQGLGKVVTTNLKNELLENFVKTLRIYKLFNTGIQVDISFLPEPYQSYDLTPELASNQLVRFNEVGKLSRKWQELQTPVTNKVFSNSFFVSKSQEDSDYIGGSLTLFVELLDTDIKVKLPNPAKNAVKGFLRYRRFYRLNNEPQKAAECEGYSLTFKSDGPRVPLVYTVDLFKNFNLKNISPMEESLEIYPGFLASNNEGRKELMPDILTTAGQSISLGQFFIYQKQSASWAPGFRIRKLVFDLKDHKLDAERSSVEQEKISAHDRKNYFKKCEKSLKTYLKLDSILPGGVL